eukprot:TRINITY_DN22232_c0_g1_i5.p1 TRINITY_DN22232_c0_g1~~TRINITY_DN22232_c0_g1_i5.p1  ORF type:complete len:544 (-),score=98.14 TRINITY_DN22232_c0_g1_i5:368-1999(-)
MYSDRPLLDFLIRYSIVTRQSDFLSDLYWTLYCMSQDDAPPEPSAEDLQPFSYAEARCALLHALSDDTGSELPLALRSEVKLFIKATRQQLRNQREIWRQQVELFTKHSGRTSGGGAWTLRTEVLRNALRNWTHHRRQVSPGSMDDVDDSLLDPLSRGVSSGGSQPASPRSARLRSPSVRSSGSGSFSFSPNLRRQGSIDLVVPVEDSFGVSLPIDPAMQFRGVVIEESEVIPSKQAPLMLTCKTRRRREMKVVKSCGSLHGVAENQHLPRLESIAEEGTQRYLLKVGDDLRQDQLILQLMSLMRLAWQERLAESEASMLCLANFKVLAVTPSAGYVKCVADAVPLSTALHESHGRLDAWLERRRPHDMPMREVLDNFCGSVAASCVVTYVLGIGDRHLENICITPTGILFHIDFSFVLGDDPKPIAPPVRLPQQVAEALRRCHKLHECFHLSGQAYIALRPYAGLLASLLQLTAEAGGAGCSKLSKAGSAKAAIAGLRERLRIDQADDRRASSEFLCLMRESSEGLASLLLDKVHAAGLFWR